MKNKMVEAGIDAYILHRGKDADSGELVWEIYKAMQKAADEFAEPEMCWHDHISTRSR